MKLPILAAFLVFLVAPALAQETPVPAQLDDCMLRNLPEPDSIRAVRISSKDRLGAERESLLKVYGRRSPQGLRQVLVEFLEPSELKGTTFLMLERADQTEMYFRTSSTEKAKRISGASRSLTLFGSDFSYEDFEHLLAFRRAETVKRLDDDVYRDRPVYVIESRLAESSYERIVTSIDKERCVALKSELYEKGRGLRKELSVNPARVVKKGGVWLPQVALMSDLRDGSSTMLLVDSTDQDVALDEALFTIGSDVAAQP